MSTRRISKQFSKITVTFERRPDGGLRAYSDDIPGLVLSNIDPEKVFDDVIPAIEFILSEMWGVEVEANILFPIRDEPIIPAFIANKALEYVAHVA